jgi:hypothetical protein
MTGAIFLRLMIADKKPNMRATANLPERSDRRYFIWLAVICWVVTLYAWIIYPVLQIVVLR